MLPATAWAEPIETDRFEPSRELELVGVSGIDIDTGWVPGAGPIQVRFLLLVDDNVVVEMPGDAVYDWDTHELHFVGDEGEGVFDIDVGAVLEAQVRFDLLGNVFESDLIGPYDLGVFESAAFTPYLLEGNADRAVHVTRMTDPVEVFSYPIVDAVVASGSFVLDAAFDVDVALECDAIDVTSQDGDAVAITRSVVPEVLAAPEDGTDLEATAALRCRTIADLTVLLYPGVQITIGLEDFELAPFELPVPVLQGREDPLDFDALPLRFAAPEPADDESGSGGGGDGSGSGSGGADPDGSTSGEPEAGTDDGGESTAGGGEEVDGCGCLTDGRGGPWLLLLGLFFTGRRRRGAV